MGSRQTMMLLLLRLLVLRAAEAKAEAKPSQSRGGDAGLLDRAAALDAWWERGARRRRDRVRAADVGQGTLQEIGAASAGRSASSGHASETSPSCSSGPGATGGDYAYLVVPQALRGRPGVPGCAARGARGTRSSTSSTTAARRWARRRASRAVY